MALPVRAQQPMPTVGYLSGRSPSESRHLIGAFLKGLGETGFVEGRNVSIAYRWADGRYDQLPALAAELVGLPVSAIFAAGGTPPARAARAATAMIPIVFSGVNDPVAMGLVANLARPAATPPAWAR
jgi:putative ABC transport system substrate-binding protein